MYLLLIGLALVAMKFLQFGPVATWSWFLVLAPFALAMAWWAWSDASGYSARKVMEEAERRKKQRIDESRANIGTASKKNRN